MTTTINASTSTGLVNTADTSGIIKLQSNGVTTNALAWVNFNGTGTVAIRSSYNVSSITDNGTGSYTVNFATALSDANYLICGCADNTGSNAFVMKSAGSTNTTSAAYILTVSNAGTSDCSFVSVAIFGN
jgi:hypothetical protein